MASHKWSWQTPALLSALQEVTGVEGTVRVHIPFSLQDLSQIEKRSGSFSANPSAYIKEFCYLSQAGDLTWHDLYVVEASTFTPEEQGQVQAAVQTVHRPDPPGGQYGPCGLAVS